MNSGKEPLKIYFAGDLFDSKDLAGNLLMADAVEQLSGGRYKVMLPQDGECEVIERTSQSIRDADFELLLSCDIIVANFDGTDLDSGTVVEFCFAKMVDMPALLLRTDFRNSGDHTLPDGEPWNLMCSHYPRTRVLHINAMQYYHDCRDTAAGKRDLLEKFYTKIAAKTVENLDAVISEDSWLEKSQLFTQYQMALKSIGGNVPEIFNECKLRELVQNKAASGLYR